MVIKRRGSALALLKPSKINASMCERDVKFAEEMTLIKILKVGGKLLPLMSA